MPILSSSLNALDAAIDARDQPTHAHSKRVSALSDSLAMSCGLAPEQRLQLRHASRFHDIGKIGIPDHILYKPGALASEEWAVMQLHCVRGQHIFLQTERADAVIIASAIRGHHEDWDGGGYPDGLAGQNIPLLARIIRVADSYDAMAVTRPYQHARNHGQIMEIMGNERGTKLEPGLFDLFAAMIDTHPARTA